MVVVGTILETLLSLRGALTSLVAGLIVFVLCGILRERVGGGIRYAAQIVGMALVLGGLIGLCILAMSGLIPSR